MSKKTALWSLFTVVILSLAALWMLYSAKSSVIVKHKTIHDQCESQEMNEVVRFYLTNGNWQARDMNLYEIVCAYNTYPPQIQGSSVRFVTWYTINMIGRGEYITVPCYNNEYCSDPISPQPVVISTTPVWIMPDEPTSSPQ